MSHLLKQQAPVEQLLLLQRPSLPAAAVRLLAAAAAAEAVAAAAAAAAVGASVWCLNPFESDMPLCGDGTKPQNPF